MWPMARRANQDGLYLSGNGARNLAMKKCPRRRRSSLMKPHSHPWAMKKMPAPEAQRPDATRIHIHWA
jgi:hypothetical protein